MELACRGQEIDKSEDLLRKPYVVEFTGLSSILIPKENEVGNTLISIEQYANYQVK